MKHIITALALALAAIGAQAQNAAALSGSQSGAAAGADAGAAAISNIDINIPSAQPLSEVTNRAVQTGSLKTAPSFFTPAPASGPCTGRSGGISGSWLGGGVGIAAAEVDASCTLRENVRVLAAILPGLTGPEAAAVRAMLMDALANLASNAPTRGGYSAPKATTTAAAPTPDTTLASTSRCWADPIVAKRMNEKVCGQP